MVIFLGFFSLSAQQKPEEIIYRFFDTYQKQPEKAVRELYATNPWSVTVQKDIDQIINIVNGIENSMGKYSGYEPVKFKKLGTCYSQYIYLVKYERQPLLFYFNLYKVKGKWIVLSFSLNDKLEKYLE